MGTVVDDVALDREASKSGGDVVAKAAGLGVSGEKSEAIHDFGDRTIRDLDAAISGHVHPDVFEVRLGECRKAIAPHRTPLRFRAFNAARRFLPLVFTRATSLGVDVRSYSV